MKKKKEKAKRNPKKIGKRKHTIEKIDKKEYEEYIKYGDGGKNYEEY